MAEHTKIGAVIREARKQRRFTQEKIAERTGRSIDAISQIERGVNSPTIETFERIAHALNVSPSALLATLEVGGSARRALLARAVAQLSEMSDRDLQIAIRQLECFPKGP